MSNQLLSGGQSFLLRVVRAIDWVVVSLSVAIITLAVINLNSAGAGDWTGLVRDQLRFIVIGLVALIVSASIDYRMYYRGAYLMYGAGVTLVVLVDLVGQEVNNAKRWLDLGIVAFQPSELMKLLLITGIARYLHDLHARNLSGVKHLIVPTLMALLPALMIIRQPDLSTGLVCLMITIALFIATEMTFKAFSMLLVGGGATALLAYQFVLEEYQKRRIDVWQAPDLYPDSGGYQILQARIAVGNGGFLGQGVSQGTQNQLNFVPYKDTDFAFAVFAEEWGFVGTSLFLLLYLLLFLWAINIASESNERFGAVLAAGIGTLVFMHMVLNVGIVLEFFPNTGLPLPFLSYGGTSVVTVMLALGMLMSLSRARKWR